MFNMFVWFYHIFLISDLNTCPILMYDHGNQSLGPALQEYEVILPLGGPQGILIWQKRVRKLPTSTIFGHVFAIFGCFIGLLVIK